MSSTHLCRHRANSLVLQRKKKGERCSDHIFYLIRPSPCPLAPLFPPFPVQLNAEPWIGWSRCLGRADIFETLPPPLSALGEVSTEDYVGFFFCVAAGRINIISELLQLRVNHLTTSPSPLLLMDLPDTCRRSTMSRACNLHFLLESSFCVSTVAEENPCELIS